ncbi:MAG: substrate-binding domain-containing protein, partial [Gammaproteobacteria bacterium]|nr:substrate-binding domain-containing protein [Gammaproteobacteria bacterium]
MRRINQIKPCLFSPGELLASIMVFLSLFSFSVEAQQFVVAFPQDTLSNDYRLAQVKEVENSFKQYPDVKFIFSDAKGSTARLIQNIEEHVQSGIDLLMVSPDNAEALAPLITSIFRRGIPVVMVDRDLSVPEYTTLVHPDNRVIANKAATYMAKKMKGNGTILMLKGVPQASVTVDRTEAFKEVIARYPGIKIIERTANFLRSDSILVMENLIGKKIHFDAIYSQSDSMLSGVRMVFRAKNIEPSSILSVGIDYITEAKNAIASGEQDSTFRYSLCGREAVEAAMKILNGNKVSEE